jgi:DNA-binding transcriptional regulator GbsR (MarR family)
MKKTIYLICLLITLMTGLTAFPQKYKTVEDTAKLNKEYVNVSNDIVELNAKLTIAQNNLPGYKSKAIAADTDAQNAAANSSNQASKATNGEIDDAKKAKRKAKKAYEEAKDSRAANNNVSDQEDKITKLSLQINKKQQRLQELDVMRLAIAEKFKLIPAPQLQN